MPLYEYKCQKCGDVFEALQKFSDKAFETHTNCGGTVERLVSRSALQFKGSGWYVNDYPKAGNGKPASSSEEKKPARDEKKSTGAETTTPAKADTTSTKSSDTAK